MAAAAVSSHHMGDWEGVDEDFLDVKNNVQLLRLSENFDVHATWWCVLAPPSGSPRYDFHPLGLSKHLQRHP